MKITIQLSLFLLLSLSGMEYCYGQIKRANVRTKSALENYVNKSDDSFDWQNYQQVQGPEGTFYEATFISQTWQRIPWKHRLILYFPKSARYSATMLIVLRHLYNRNAGIASLKVISDSTGTASAMLYDIPNQPLFDGKEEDDLQAYTFSQFLKTGDESWPLLFPMTKSVVRAMDVVQGLARKEHEAAVQDFVVAGHSKRGHTTWLTAAVDKRIKGIIPIAIDILNSKAQLPHQLESFGEYSTPSKAATDLLQELKQPRGQSLIKMIDAYSYRKHLTIPKLIVSATNDDFFTTDALNLYWDGLKKPKWVLYLSNANHVGADSDPRINPTAFAFVRAIAAHKNLPELNWQYTRNENKMVLKIVADATATRACLWVSQLKNKDFRQALWTSLPMLLKRKAGYFTEPGESKKDYSIEAPIPPNGCMAIFGEVEFRKDGRTFLLSTQTNISSLKE
jgi:PhoPQ-activated pathogenicity-related protein